MGFGAPDTSVEWLGQAGDWEVGRQGSGAKQTKACVVQLVASSKIRPLRTLSLLQFCFVLFHWDLFSVVLFCFGIRI